MLQLQQSREPFAAPRSPTLELLRLALPNIGMTVSRMLMGFIDFVMVSHLGTAAQAAISPSTLLLYVFACVGMGMTQGVQTFVSQADGRGEPRRAGAYVWHGLYIALAAALLSAPIALLAPLWFPIIGRWGHHPPDVQAMEIGFLRIALWSIGPMTACMALESFYNGIRRPMIGLAGVVVSLITITIGNYLLIFGRHIVLAPFGEVWIEFTIPAMGIQGSGMATLLAWSVRCVVLLIPLLSSWVDRRFNTRRSLRFSLARLREIVGVGGAIAAQWLVDIGAWMFFLQFMMPPFGREAMAGANLAIQFMHLSFMPALGLGVALTTQVGNAIGAERLDQVDARVRVARRLVLGYMGAMSLMFLTAGRPLAALLCLEQDAVVREQVLRAATWMMMWVALFQVSDALCVVYSFAARGAGDTRVPALLFALCCWVIFVAGGCALLYLAPSWGYHGPWAMCTLYIIVLGALLWWRFHSRAWERIRLFREPSAPAADAAAP
jgi:MATE family multidrug resistance protein